MVGLGVMGRNFLLNMADHGHSVAGYDKDSDKVAALRQEAENRDIRGAADIKEFIALLSKPRAIMMLVPAGAPVDSVIKDLLPHLDQGDLIIDAGNSYFKDTDLRARNLTGKGIQFLGVGVSGGEEGARHGPSIMPGGPKEAYERVRPIFEAAAAKVNGAPCVTWLGPGSAGHFVKMVHNGIEYGVMQLLAETYDLMKRGSGLNDDELRDVYAAWHQGELNSYLVEITGHIFSRRDEKTGKRLIDEILDVAKQKGTGMWTSQSAMELQVPIPTIDLAVARYREAMVFQSGALFDSLTVGENVGFYLTEHRLKPPGEIARIVSQMLDLVGLKGTEAKMPGELSGGMTKRVAIARALVVQPQLIFYDEPTSGLDPLSSVAIARVIVSLNKRIHVTSLVVSHDRDLAFGIADRIAVINDGRILTIGTPHQIKRSPDPWIQQFLNASLKRYEITPEDLRPQGGARKSPTPTNDPMPKTRDETYAGTQPTKTGMLV